MVLNYQRPYIKKRYCPDGVAPHEVLTSKEMYGDIWNKEMNNVKMRVKNRKKYKLHLKEKSSTKTELQSIIANALIEADKIKQDETESKKKEERENFHNAVGYKETGKSLINHLKLIWYALKICFLPKEKIKGNYFILETIKYIVGILFDGIKILLVFGFATCAWQLAACWIKDCPMLTVVVSACALVGCVCIWAIIKLMKYEVENIKDRATVIELASLTVASLSLLANIIRNL